MPSANRRWFQIWLSTGVSLVAIGEIFEIFLVSSFTDQIVVGALATCRIHATAPRTRPLLSLKNLSEFLEVWRFDVDLFGIVSIDERAVFEKDLRINRIEPIVPSTGEEIVTVVSISRLKVEFLLNAMQLLLLLLDTSPIALLFNVGQVRFVDSIQMFEVRIHSDVSIEDARQNDESSEVKQRGVRHARILSAMCEKTYSVRRGNRYASVS